MVVMSTTIPMDWIFNKNYVHIYLRIHSWNDHKQQHNENVVIMGTEKDEDDEEEEMIITSKLQLVLAAKSRKLQYTSSPIISHHVSLSLLSSPDDLSHTRASVPFSWEEEPGKPKHHTLVRAPPNYPKRLHLPPRLLLPNELTTRPLASDHPPHLAALKRFFRWKKDRADEDDADGKRSFVSSSENGNDAKIARTTSRLHCLSDVARCYLREVPWKKKKKLKRDDF